MKFCIHKYGNWSVPYVDQFGGEGKLLQAIKCEKCGRVKIARVPQPVLSRTHLADLLSRFRLSA
jgi:hypothetical protein